MKFTKHQQDIISKIISGEVYDIKSYLNFYQKCHIEQYDMNSLRAAFEKSENDKEYKVIKEGCSLYTSVPMETAMGRMSFPQRRLKIPENEYEMKRAIFIDKAPHLHYTYENREFEFDFCAGISIADDFGDVVDFITLWSYLKREALILEVNEVIDTPDIGLFFEKVSADRAPEKEKVTVEIDDMPIALLPALDIDVDVLEEAPKRFAHEYSDSTWSINEEHLLICHDFLGKRIIPTSLLWTFANKNYRTNDQIAQDNNFRIAIVALIVSVLSIAFGVFSPWLQPTQPEITTISKQLSTISNQLLEIRTQLLSQGEKEDNYLDNVLHGIDDLKNEIERQSVVSSISDNTDKDRIGKDSTP